MNDGLTNELCWISLGIGTLCALIATRRLPLAVAVLVAAVRVIIPLVYFAWYYNSGWTILDDQVYFASGNELMRSGDNPLSILLNTDGFNYLCTLSHGRHFLYVWWNMLAQYLLGEHYYATIFLNVLLTFASAELFARSLKLLGFGGRYVTWATVFLLLHWDITAWSSFINLKDVLVQTLTVAAIWSGLRFVETRRLGSLILFIAIAQLFLWIRFYLLFLLMGAAAIWMLTQWRDARKYLLLPVAFAILFGSLRALGHDRELLDPSMILSGTVRFALTPQPWSIAADYSFLFGPSILHWVLFIPMLFGMWMIWRRSASARMLLIYAALVIVLYGVTEDLLGPRQRLQISFIIAWGQFHFLWQMAAGAGAIPRAQMQSTAITCRPALSPT